MAVDVVACIESRPTRSVSQRSGRVIRSAAVAAIGLAVTGCGGLVGEPPGGGSGSLSTGFQHHWDVDASVADCLAAGYTEQSPVRLDAERGSRAEMIAINDLAATDPSVIADCVNLDERLARRIDELGGTLTAGCVEPDRLAVWPLARHLARDAELSDLDRRSRPQAIDAVRGCVEDAAFARVADLPDPERLRRVLIADPFAASAERGDQDPCFAGAVLEIIGVERLHELGVRLDQPSFLKVRYQLDDDESRELLDGLETCDLTARLRRWLDLEHPQVADCVMDGLTSAQRDDWISKVVLSGTSFVGADKEELRETCAEQEVEELYGTPPVGSALVEEVTLFAFGETMNPFEERCLMAGLRTITTEADVINSDEVLTEWEAGREVAEVAKNGFWDYMLAMHDVFVACLRPWVFLRADLNDAAIVGDHFPCIRLEVGDEVARELLDVTGLAWWAGDPGAYTILEQGLEEVGRAVDRCGGPDEMAKWQSYVDELLNQSTDGTLEA